MKTSKPSQLPPLVPPPPPPPLPASESKSAIEKTKEFMKSETENLDASLKQLLSSNSKLNKIFYMKNTFLRSQLQEGPKCGLVALSIATSATGRFVNVDSIFDQAIAKGLTKQGEIFDAQFLAFLAEENGFKVKVIDGGLNSHLSCIIKSLLCNKLLLVPYDADFNHSPCCKRGHKAHWAVICGFTILEITDEEKSAERDESPQENNFVLLNHKNGTNECNCVDDNLTKEDFPLKFSDYSGKLVIGKRCADGVGGNVRFKEGQVFLIGMQGKSRHFGLWSFHEMAASNDNLTNFSTSRDSEFYVLPNGGLLEGLKGKAVILSYSTES